MKMKPTQFLLAALTLAVAALLAAVVAWAQADTPIIITDGSLNLRSETPWAQYSSGNRTRRHPHGNKAVTSVDLVVNGNRQTFSFSNQKCTVTIVYGTPSVSVSSGNNGRGMQVDTDFAQFRPGANANLMAHVDASKKISTITVMKGSQTVFNGTGNGGTSITIHYQ